MKLKTLFMGTPDYVIPTLSALREHSELVGIVTAPDKVAGRGNKIVTPAAKDFALKHGVRLYQPKTLKNNDIVEELSELKPDLLVVNAYGFLLPQSVLSMPELAPINLHGSLLPSYRGASPIQASLLNGDSETGITAQYMSERLDEGDIVLQLKTPIEPEDDYYSLSDRLSQLSADCILEVLRLYEENRVVRQPQDSARATFCHKIKKEDGAIQFNETYKSIVNKMKAYAKWPLCYAYQGKKKVIIHKVEWLGESQEGEPGIIVQANKQGLHVRCGDGVMAILMIQPESKKVMDYKSFLNGHSWKPGMLLTHVAEA